MQRRSFIAALIALPFMRAADSPRESDRFGGSVTLGQLQVRAFNGHNYVRLVGRGYFGKWTRADELFKGWKFETA